MTRSPVPICDYQAVMDRRTDRGGLMWTVNSTRAQNRKGKKCYSICSFLEQFSAFLD